MRQSPCYCPLAVYIQCILRSLSAPIVREIVMDEAYRTGNTNSRQQEENGVHSSIKKHLSIVMLLISQPSSHPMWQKYRLLSSPTGIKDLPHGQGCPVVLLPRFQTTLYDDAAQVMHGNPPQCTPGVLEDNDTLVFCPGHVPCVL